MSGEAGAFSTTIPDLESTGNMTVEFSRNVNSFPINRYSKLRPVEAIYGFYLQIDPNQAMRVPNADGREFAWVGGSRRPTGSDNRSLFNLAQYRCQRFAHSVPLDDLAVGQATWDVGGVELRKLGQQLMTLRARRAALALANASWGTHTSTIANIPYNGSTIGASHNWGNGTAATPWIQISLQYAQILIEMDTGGLVQASDLCLVISPDSATAMSQSPEIRSYLGNSFYAYPFLEGQLPGFPKGAQKNRGLPPLLYDTPICIENTVAVTVNKGSNTQTKQFAIPFGTAYLLARSEGELIEPNVLAAERAGKNLAQKQLEAIPVYDTLIGFFQEEMTVERKEDSWDRMTGLSIATNYDYEISSILSGYKFTGTFS